MLLVMQYGTGIRAHRERLGLSQTAFAQRLGIPDAGTISRWELGKAIPSPERLEQLREDGADLPPRTEPRTLGQRVAALEEAVDKLLSEQLAADAGRHASLPGSSLRNLPVETRADDLKDRSAGRGPLPKGRRKRRTPTDPAQG